MPSTNPSERLALIKENLAEFLNPEIIEAIVNEGRNPRIYWGTATVCHAFATLLKKNGQPIANPSTRQTGRPHAGYLVPGVKIAQLLAAGCDMVILLADVCAPPYPLRTLLAGRPPIELVEHRVKYYRFAITALLQACGVSTDKVEFVLGSSYQKTPDYIMDIYKMCSLTSEHDAKKAGAEIVKQSANTPLSGLLYPILQVLDEQYLNVDAQFGGLDQRKLFTAAKEWLPKLGYRQRAHLMNDMIPGLQGGKMSSSDENSKIDLLDSPDVVSRKIKKAEAAPRVAEGNGLLAYIEHVFLPVAELKGKREFIVSRERDGLEPLLYTTIAQMRSDYENDVLTPQLLKPAVTKALHDIMIPIQDAYNASKEWQEVTLLAYPPPEKKQKKVKKIGTRYPAAGQDKGEAAADNASDMAKLNLENEKS
ncbi:tyrosyl-tRNA synthetase [Xylaria curta]|nr:tyrosyl-tRNA synthetase [Xylaria curta]